MEGPKGKLQQLCRPEVRVRLDEANRQLVVEVLGQDRTSRAYHGLTRALLQNMVVGVTEGYQKKLEIVGVGYLASVAGRYALRCEWAMPTKSTRRSRRA